MYVCMHACMFIRMYIRIYMLCMSMYVCKDECMYVWVCMSVCMHAYTHVCIRSNLIMILFLVTSMQAALDPLNILNPGKMGSPSTSFS